MESLKNKRAFTLLEVLLSVAIFMLIAGGIYTAVSAGITASNEVGRVRLESERLDACQRFLRMLFTNLPSSATVQLRTRNWRDGQRMVEVLIEPAPECARFSPKLSAAGLSLAAIPDGKGLYRFSLANYDLKSAQEREVSLEKASWILLLPDLKEVRWKFAKSNQGGMQEVWDASSGRPALAELRMGFDKENLTQFDFLIPQLTAPPSVQTLQNQ